MADSAGSVLVVDDSPQICKTLSDVLGMAGYTVRTAPSAERALQIMDSTSFDLIITDLKMSGMSGMDFVAMVKQRVPGLSIVILSGFGDMDDVIGAMRAGVADYIKKPFSIDEVLNVVKREVKKSPSRLGAAPASPPPAATPAPGFTLAPTGAPPAASTPAPRVYIFSQTDLTRIDSVLSKLRAQATAEAVLLIEEAGYVIAAKGMVADKDLSALSSLVVSGRSMNNQLATLLGEGDGFAMNYLEGQRMSVYTTGLGRGLFLVIVVPKGTRQGVVWLYAKEAAAEIDVIVRKAAADVQKESGKTVEQMDKTAVRQEMAQTLDKLFDEEAIEEEPPAETPTLTFEQAMQMGLLKNLDQSGD
jgi:CheY-like chemotaxis protein/predicted regulator of Ras-like GTPase activity (Roadblock/LC7/MglB family)